MNELEAVINNIVDLRYKNLVEDNQDLQKNNKYLLERNKNSQIEIKKLKQEIEDLKRKKQHN